MKKTILNILYTVVIIFLLIKACEIYKLKNFNGFTKAAANTSITFFERDSQTKFSDIYSYKIESESFNDAIIFKTIEVEENTPYKVTCMVKTNNVIQKEESKLGGAQICISDTTECSKSITGTTQWQELTFLFNSKNRESVDIGFRLGGYDSECKGTAWFSDFKIEKGVVNTDNNWNFACFIFENTDIDMNQNGVTLKANTKMSKNDIENVKSNLARFKKACNSLSGGLMTASCDIYEIIEPITKVSYDEDNGYYVSPYDVSEIIDKYLENDEYDHIFIVFRLGEIAEINKNKKDWIGLRWDGLL